MKSLTKVSCSYHEVQCVSSFFCDFRVFPVSFGGVSNDVTSRPLQTRLEPKEQRHRGLVVALSIKLPHSGQDGSLQHCAFSRSSLKTNRLLGWTTGKFSQSVRCSGQLLQREVDVHGPYHSTPCKVWRSTHCDPHSWRWNWA